MSDSGIRGILWTCQPAGRHKVDRTIALARKDPSFMCVVDDPIAVNALNEAAGASSVILQLIVDVDIGLGRQGVQPGEPALRLVLERGLEDKVASVRVRALGGLALLGPRLPEGLRREAQAKLAGRAAREDDPDAREQLLRLIASYDYRSAAGLRELELIAKKTGEPVAVRERMLVALASQPVLRALTAIVEMVDELPEGPRWVANRELGNATGLVAKTTADWRRALNQAAGDVKRRLKEREDQESKDFDARKKDAEKRRDELRKG